MSVTVVWRALLAAFLVVCAVAPSPASASSRHDATEAGIVRAMNSARAGYGLPALHTSSGLARAADEHSASMLRSNTMSHGAFSQRVRRYVHVRRVGENLAWMNKCNASQIVRMWLASAEHRHIMLSRSFRRVGVARRASSSICYVTADFATAN